MLNQVVSFGRFLGVALSVGVFLTGCSKISTKNDEEIVTKRERIYKGYGKFFGEDALLFGGDDNIRKAPDVGIGVNTYLWRATLDTLSFMPLQTVDPFGGVITTDWYSQPSNPNERTRVNVRILDRVLRADGLTITVFRQNYVKGRWIHAKVSPKTAEQLENAILRKARHLKSSGQ